MKRLVAAVVACVVFEANAVRALQLTLDRRAIEQAVFIGQSRVESERSRFHAPYRVRVAQPPIDWIDVITPFHRVELVAETAVRNGRRMISQREALSALGDTPQLIDFLVEMTFHPQNTFVAVPSYQVELKLPDGRSVEPLRMDRFPRFGPRSESTGPALPDRTASTAFGGGQPVLGATMVAVVDGAAIESHPRLDLVVWDGKKELVRAAVDLGQMR